MKNWMKVYKFTFMQTIKNKFFSKVIMWISLIIFSGIILGNVVPAINDLDNNVDSETLKTINVLSETEIDSDSFVSVVNGCENIKFIKSKDTKDESTSKIKGGDDRDGLLYITKEATGYKMELIVSPNTKISSEYKAKLISQLRVAFNSIRLSNAGVDQEQMKNLLLDVETSVLSADEISKDQYSDIVKLTIKLSISALLMAVLILFGDSIANSVAQEKFSKVIELLLTSVKPIDIVIGKILAMVSIVLLQVSLIFISITSSLYISVKAIEYLNPEYSNITIKVINYVKDSGTFNNLTVIDIMLVIISFLVGITFFFLFAAITGAVIKKAEDISIGLLPYELFACLGIVVTAFLNNYKNDVIENIGNYCPITSPYLLPINLLIGKISAGEAIISIAILLISTFILIKVISVIYISVILYNGQKIDIKKIYRALKI